MMTIMSASWAGYEETEEKGDDNVAHIGISLGIAVVDLAAQTTGFIV